VAAVDNCVRNPWPNRQASLKPLNGPRRQRCCMRKARLGRAPLPRAIGVVLKDQDDLEYVAPQIDTMLERVAS
jgi:hypothetical protein